MPVKVPRSPFNDWYESEEDGGRYLMFIVVDFHRCPNGAAPFQSVCAGDGEIEIAFV